MAATTILSSDRLEAQFGPTEIIVLEHTKSQRTIQTRVIASSQILEQSNVHFEPGALDRWPAIAADLAAGISMGKAFRQHDITFERRELTSFKANVAPGVLADFATPNPCLHIEVLCLAAGQPFAKIMEIYSSAVSWT